MPLLSSCHALERGRLVCSPSSHAQSTSLSISARLRSPHWHGQHRQCHVLCQAEQQPAEVASTSSSASANGSRSLATAPGTGTRQDQQPDTPLNRVSTGPLWEVPWDVWSVMLVTAALFVINQTIPLGGQWLLATLQGVSLDGLSAEQRENVGAVAQLGQLAVTYLVIQAATKEHQPLPKPWFWYDLNLVAGLQAVSALVVAVGAGVAIAGLDLGAGIDGSSEWRGLVAAESHPAAPALILGAVLLAPLTEEYLFRGYLLSSLTKWCWPPVAVLVSGGLFAMAHPSSQFVPEAATGVALGAAYLASRGNLLVPTLAHAGYNAAIILAAALFATS